MKIITQSFNILYLFLNIQLLFLKVILYCPVVFSEFYSSHVMKRSAVTLEYRDNTLLMITRKLILLQFNELQLPMTILLVNTLLIIIR